MKRLPILIWQCFYIDLALVFLLALQWRHNVHDGVSNHQPDGCLLNRLFRRKSKKTSKLRVTGLCVGNSPGPVNSPHKGPVTRKMFPFYDVIMGTEFIQSSISIYLIYGSQILPVMKQTSFLFTNVFLFHAWKPMTPPVYLLGKYHSPLHKITCFNKNSL